MGKRSETWLILGDVGKGTKCSLLGVNVGVAYLG